jgi:uncharacterized membrane protein (GlpM family)
MDIVWKAIVGGLVTAAIALLSRRGNVLPGILPLFPTFAVIALLLVGAKGDHAGFREACMAGAKTIPAYLAFLAVCFRRRSCRLPHRPRRRAGGVACRRAGHLPPPALDLTTIPVLRISRENRCRLR